jgi:hypothetical protein
MGSRNNSNQTGGSFASRYHVWRGASRASTCALAGKRRRDGDVMVVVEECGADVASEAIWGEISVG